MVIAVNESSSQFDSVNPFTFEGTLKRPRLKNIIKYRLLEIAFQIFFPAFVGRYSSCEK